VVAGFLEGHIRCLEHLQRLGHDLGADPVAADHGEPYLGRCHARTLLVAGPATPPKLVAGPATPPKLVAGPATPPKLVARVAGVPSVVTAIQGHLDGLRGCRRTAGT